MSGDVGRLAQALPSPARAALAHSYRVGFTEAFTSILTIACAIALAGAVAGFALVRSRDFVASATSPAPRQAAAVEVATP